MLTAAMVHTGHVAWWYLLRLPSTNLREDLATDSDLPPIATLVCPFQVQHDVHVHSPLHLNTACPLTCTLALFGLASIPNPPRGVGINRYRTLWQQQESSWL